MKLSYSWLKDYIDLDINPNKLSSILTQIGLEVGAVEEVETIKGGLRGLVIGEVISCEPHENSEHLSKTTVNVGQEELLPIVCGAPNVAAGQKVVVATVGTVLYDGDQEFVIKKSKIRGELSLGMICAEDEIGLGTSHDGILVLPADAKVGTPASDYYKVESDYVFEIELTPNRIDSASHIGIARDLAAYLKQTRNITYTQPAVDEFKVDNNNLQISVEIENTDACHRYSGVTISGVKIAESPRWLQNRLKLIGLNPINNVVDATNYVLFETGQPLHAFDAAEIKGNKVVVKTMAGGTRFSTLDGIERELNENDLMICNAEEGMCIAGVFGGVTSGVKESTTDLFLESACFDPVYIRKTARRLGLSTDASFRFERGTDPNATVYALKRAALLIQEVAGGSISSDVIDLYPNPVQDFEIEVFWSNITRLLGKDLGKETIKKILSALEIKIASENEEAMMLHVPPYRVDVRREADVIEEILRIYGYNNIEPGKSVKSTIQYSHKPDPLKVQNLISEMLSACGFNEIMNNSLTKASYYENLKSYKEEKSVKIFNPLSQDLNGMRQTLLFGGLECVAYNTNRKNSDLRLYEFGNCYFYNGSKDTENPVKNYSEEIHLGLWLAGNKETVNWTSPEQQTNFFELKTYVENILTRLGYQIHSLQIDPAASDLFGEGLTYSTQNGKVLADFGLVSRSILKNVEIDGNVYYADINWSKILSEIEKHKVIFKELPKYPEVRRDLALLLDAGITFKQVKELAFKSERKLLRSIGLFDVYEGKNLPSGKKSYAVSFILRDDEKTLKDKQIEKIMKKLISTYERELGAQIR